MPSHSRCSNNWIIIKALDCWVYKTYTFQISYVGLTSSVNFTINFSTGLVNTYWCGYACLLPGAICDVNIVQRAQWWRELCFNPLQQKWKGNASALTLYQFLVECWNSKLEIQNHVVESSRPLFRQSNNIPYTYLSIGTLSFTHC